ncbi:MAG: class I SAM-dependent methyltransferase [Proteobacteria bacterium]|nr:class I SAM-dependent methyltransferase [Pseudomonadota bacterium]
MYVNSTTEPAEVPATLLHLHQTRSAFDSVAADYDGERGNNAAIQDMRAEAWRWLDASFAPGSHLLDLGCGTGLDAVRLARLGHLVTAADWSAAMVRRTFDRARDQGLGERVRAVNIGAHELQRLGETGVYDGAYSNLGALNCLPDLNGLARECARLLKPGGLLVFTVIGRICPWEVIYYLRQRRWARVKVRYARGPVPVSLNQRTVWTRYYGPREFYRPFADWFTLEHMRGMCIFVPPPYLASIRTRHPQWYRLLWRIDRRVAGWPLLRGLGDHFLIVMRAR